MFFSVYKYKYNTVYDVGGKKSSTVKNFLNVRKIEAIAQTKFTL
jgi:hypothetical protein